MSEELKKKLRLIQEGAIGDSSLMDDDDDDDEFDLDDLDDEFLAEVTLALLEAEVGTDKMGQFMTENSGMLVRDKLLTEDVAGKSFIVLSPAARRQKAINLMKLRMAKQAGDQRYKKLIIARKLVKALLHQIRTDSRYQKADVIIRKQRFQIISNPEAAAAMKRASSMQLR